MLRDRIEEYLVQHTTLNLATYGPGGLWACAVLYINVGTTLYFTSVATTRHGLNINTSNAISGTINDDCKSFETMAGVQLAGLVEKVVDLEERRRVVQAYLAKFPFSTALWHGEAAVDVIARDPGAHDFYRITPTQLLFTATGKREELAVA
jgi:uncharacterized protein YhbP (UPF0306 family)